MPYSIVSSVPVVAAGNTSKRRRVATENSRASDAHAVMVAPFYLVSHASAANTANNCLVVS